MRLVICYISIVSSTLMMSGCGQSGALQLASDPHYDKRAKYLLYPDQPASVQGKKTEVIQESETKAVSPSATPEVAVQ